MAARRHALSLLLLCIGATPAGNADVYRYQDESGRWVFTDRQPPPGKDYEQTAGVPASREMPGVDVRRVDAADASSIRARNECLCPMQVAVWLTAAENATLGDDSQGATVLLAPRAEQTVIEVRPRRRGSPWSFEFEYGFVPGDPKARHAPTEPYRPPFAAATAYELTQAWPDQATHNTADSRYAVDIAMPEGAPVYAAREGLVVAVAYANFEGGSDRDQYVRRANQVRILHDDGTFGVYAHLAWDSIRVRPGQRVARGERIAASGNTGFTTGPHLHFAVLRNAGLQVESVPVEFADGRGNSLRPSTGMLLANP